MYGLRKVEAGEYRSADGEWTVLREDMPSMREWDDTPIDVTWYVVPTANAASAGLPESLFEAPTLRLCAEWIRERAPR